MVQSSYGARGCTLGIASAAAPMTAASGPERGGDDRALGRAGQGVRAQTRRAPGSSRASPSAARPPPMTIKSGSRALARLTRP